jgi:large subunit ribosomal protein L25
MAKFTLKAQPRTELGSRAMVKVRASGRLPANIYGHKKDNRLVTFDVREISQFIAAGHRFLTVEVAGVEENGMLKEVQYSSFGTDVVHVDIARIDIHEKVAMPVRIVTIGTPKGITAGGNLDIAKREVMVEGPASSIPEKIDLNIADLELGQALRIKDLKPVPDCRFLDDAEQVVASVQLKKLEEVAPAAPGVVATAEMPKVIGEEERLAKEKAEAEAGEAEGKKKEKEKDKDEGKK